MLETNGTAPVIAYAFSACAMKRPDPARSPTTDDVSLMAPRSGMSMTRTPEYAVVALIARHPGS